METMSGNESGTRQLLRRFFTYYQPHRTLFALDFSCAVLSGVLELGFPMAVGLFIDRLLPGQDWTLILIAGRLAIPREQYEAASVDGASAWQKFKYVTWPSLRTLYLTSTILSMIWTLGDFNSVYLLTGGGPADLTHVLATLGIRYIRLDQVDMAMATIVCAMPLVLPLVYFMMKNLSKADRQ